MKYLNKYHPKLKESFDILISTAKILGYKIDYSDGLKVRDIRCISFNSKEIYLIFHKSSFSGKIIFIDAFAKVKKTKGTLLEKEITHSIRSSKKINKETLIYEILKWL